MQRSFEGTSLKRDDYKVFLSYWRRLRLRAQPEVPRPEGSGIKVEAEIEAEVKVQTERSFRKLNAVKSRD
ncbi:MAG: hypothetical protein EA361_07305 [Bacteroidetes bacterium]|nr:MAG: hypothetical protein EA361_07305 [Bacteroidota bacterium]